MANAKRQMLNDGVRIRKDMTEKKMAEQVALPGQRLVRRIAPRPSPAGPAAAPHSD
jgi:hypothetical protein